MIGGSWSLCAGILLSLSFALVHSRCCKLRPSPAMAASHRLLTLCCLCVLGCTQGLADGDGPEKAACIDSHEADESSAVQSHPIRRKRIRRRAGRPGRRYSKSEQSEPTTPASPIPAFSVVGCSGLDGPGVRFRDLVDVGGDDGQAHMRAGLGDLGGGQQSRDDFRSGDVYSPTGADSAGELTVTYQAPAEGLPGFIQQTYASTGGTKSNTFGGESEDNIFYQGDACPTERPADCFPSDDPPAGCSEANWDSRTDDDCFDQSGINVLEIVSWICSRPFPPFGILGSLQEQVMPKLLLLFLPRSLGIPGFERCSLSSRNLPVTSRHQHLDQRWKSEFLARHRPLRLPFGRLCPDLFLHSRLGQRQLGTEGYLGLWAQKWPLQHHCKFQ